MWASLEFPPELNVPSVSFCINNLCAFLNLFKNRVHQSVVVKCVSNRRSICLCVSDVANLYDITLMNFFSCLYLNRML